MAARLIYGSVCKLKLGWDGECLDKVIAANARKFLTELLQVCKTLQPVPRAWVPIGNEFDQLICPVDGGEQGFAAHGYVRSQDTTHGSYCSRLGVARCKVSNLSVPDNEQAGLLLGLRVVEHMLTVLPEAPIRNIGVSFLSDSQCTALSLNPSLSQKDCRKYNVSIRIRRPLANIY